MRTNDFCKGLLLSLMLMISASAFAHDFEVDGIYYNRNSDGTSVSVTYKGKSYQEYYDEYSGAVVIPESVTYNGTVYSVTTIGNYAFYCCSGLTSIDIPNGVTEIGNSTFSGCSRLTSIDIPNGVTTIGDLAFYCCSDLTSIDIPNSVTEIGNSTFSGCSRLTSIEIPNSVTSIDRYAFEGCRGLKSVVIGNSVTSIGVRAFWRCSGLESFSFGTGLKRIEQEAFVRCTALTEIHAKATTPPFCGSGAFGAINKETCTLYVPDASLSQYQAADQWKDFILMTTDGIQTTTDNATCAKEATRYNLGGQRLNGNQRGLNIIKYSDGTIKKVMSR